MKKEKQLRLPSRDRELVDFTRELIAIPSPSGGEGEAQHRIAGEMEKMGWEEIRLDRAGNLHGRIGSGERVLIDRRFCPGEDESSLLAEIRKLSAGLDCDITIPVYRKTSFAGMVLEGKSSSPAGCWRKTTHCCWPPGRPGN